MARLGLIDWGIGGIGVYREAKRRFGDIAITYWSDTGQLPYGTLSRREMAVRLEFIISRCVELGVTDVVVACNAASTALPDVRPIDGVIVTGMIEPAVAAAIKKGPTHLGVIGGRRTIVSGAYRKAFASHGIDISQRVAQPLSALIEAGEIDGPTMNAECERILRPLYNCSHILLACTHYPAAAAAIARSVSPNTVLLDPAADVVATLDKNFEAGNDVFFTTGDAREMRSAAKMAFGVEIGEIKKLNV